MRAIITFLAGFIFYLALFNAQAFGAKVYTIQLATTKDRSYAEKVFKKINKLEYSRIDYDGKYYKVRIGFFKSYLKAKDFLKKHPEIKKVAPSSYITINFYKPKVTIEKGFFPTPNSRKREVAKPPKKQAEKTVKKEEKKVLIKKSNATAVTAVQRKTSCSSLMCFYRKNGYLVISVSFSFLKAAFTILAAFAAGLIAFLKRRDLFKLLKRENLKEASGTLVNRGLRALFRAKLCGLLGACVSCSEGYPMPECIRNRLREIYYKTKGDFHSLFLHYINTGNYAGVLKEVPKYMAEHPDDVFVMRLYGEILTHLGRYEDAVKIYEKLVDTLERKGMRYGAAELYRRKVRELRRLSGENWNGQTR